MKLLTSLNDKEGRGLGLVGGEAVASSGLR